MKPKFEFNVDLQVCGTLIIFPTLMFKIFKIDTFHPPKPLGTLDNKDLYELNVISRSGARKRDFLIKIFIIRAVKEAKIMRNFIIRVSRE